MTASGNLVMGKATAGGEGGNGKGGVARVAGMIAAVAFLLSLLAGGVIAHGHRETPSVARLASTVTSVIDQPEDASMSLAFRWDFGPARPGVRPVDASVADGYRWAFREAPPVASATVASDQAAGPVPADASTSAEYRWDFERYPSH